MRKAVSTGNAANGPSRSAPSNVDESSGGPRYSRTHLSGIDPLAASAYATIRSLIADLEIKAHINQSPLQVLPLQLNGRVVARAYCFERRLAGIRTGIYDGVVVLAASWEQGLTSWLCHRLQDFASSDLASFRIVEETVSPFVVESSVFRNRSMLAATSGSGFQEVLPLAGDFNDFLDRFGRSTRRNITRGLDYAHENGLAFHFTRGVTPPGGDSLRRLAAKNMPQRQSFRKIERVQDFLAATPHPFAASLVDRHGRLVSAAGGFIEDDLAFLAYQSNNRAYRQANLSLILRALIVEQLIEERVRGLGFIGSCAGLLLHYCERVRGAELLLARYSWAARMKQLACALTQPQSRIGQLTGIILSGEAETSVADSDQWGADRFAQLQSELKQIRLPRY